IQTYPPSTLLLSTRPYLTPKVLILSLIVPTFLVRLFYPGDKRDYQMTPTETAQLVKYWIDRLTQEKEAYVASLEPSPYDLLPYEAKLLIALKQIKEQQLLNLKYQIVFNNLVRSHAATRRQRYLERINPSATTPFLTTENSGSLTSSTTVPSTNPSRLVPNYTSKDNTPSTDGDHDAKEDFLDYAMSTRSRRPELAGLLPPATRPRKRNGELDHQSRSQSQGHDSAPDPESGATEGISFSDGSQQIPSLVGSYPFTPEAPQRGRSGHHHPQGSTGQQDLHAQQRGPDQNDGQGPRGDTRLIPPSPEGQQYNQHENANDLSSSTAGINRLNTAVRAVLKQPCSTGGRTGTVRPKHLPPGRTGLSDQFLGPVAQDQPGPVGQICPTSWLLLRSDSARPTTGRTRLFEHRSNCRVQPVNAGSEENQKSLQKLIPNSEIESYVKGWNPWDVKQSLFPPQARREREGKPKSSAYRQMKYDNQDTWAEVADIASAVRSLYKATKQG
ncbi:hypothetical protein PCANC_27650, partial [Puccinia coronata f. sp. avenae]